MPFKQIKIEHDIMGQIANDKDLQDYFKEFCRQYELAIWVRKLIKDNIIVDKSIRFGKPTIKGTRITVDDIIQLILDGYSIKDILEQYPSLTDEKLLAALLYPFRKSLTLKL